MRIKTDSSAEQGKWKRETEKEKEKKPNSNLNKIEWKGERSPQKNMFHSKRFHAKPDHNKRAQNVNDFFFNLLLE